MRHEKIIKRADGSRVKLIVSIKDDGYSNNFAYKVIAHTCEPKKRTWVMTYSSDNFSFRRLTMDERDEYVKNSILSVASKEEILEAKLELWQLIKPV